MTRLTAEAVNTARTLAVWLLRSVAVALIAVGSYLMLKRLAFGAGIGDFSTALKTFMEIGEGQSFYRGIAMVIVGAALGLASRRIGVWAFPTPLTGCPACGYEQAPPAGGCCPECGLAGADGPAGDRAA